MIGGYRSFGTCGMEMTSDMVVTWVEGQILEFR